MKASMQDVGTEDERCATAHSCYACSGGKAGVTEGFSPGPSGLNCREEHSPTEQYPHREEANLDFLGPMPDSLVH